MIAKMSGLEPEIAQGSSGHEQKPLFRRIVPAEIAQFIPSRASICKACAGNEKQASNSYRRPAFASNPGET
jgi:hypothetical protein